MKTNQPLDVTKLFRNLNKIGKYSVRNQLFGRMKKLSLPPIVWNGILNHDCENGQGMMENNDEGENHPITVIQDSPIEIMDNDQPIVNDNNFESVSIIEQIIVDSEEPHDEEEMDEITHVIEHNADMECDEITIDSSILSKCSHEFPKESSNFKGFKASEFQSVVLDHCDKVRTQLSHKIGLVVLATGMGKTILVILDIERELRRKIEKSGKESLKNFKVLFLVHSKVIRDATFNKFKTQFMFSSQKDLDSEWEFLESDFLNVSENENQSTLDNKVKRAKFIFCLFQSFEKISKEVNFTHCIIDEVHHVVATTYNKVFKKLMKLSSLEYMLG